MSETQTNPASGEQTSVKEIVMEIDQLFPGVSSVVTASDEETKPGFFSNKQEQLDFLDQEDQETTTEPVTEIKDILDEQITPEESQEEEAEPEAPSKGRPKTEKSALTGYLKDKIEKGEMFAFDDFDDSKQSLDEYLGTLPEKDLRELLEANIQEREKQVAAQTPKEFFEALPKELQYAAQYVMDGGTDMKGLFRALAQVEEVRELNPANEPDQKHIVRQYLAATGHEEQEIEDQITEWEEFGTLAKKAEIYKPKLDKMQEQIVAQQLAQQEEYNRQRQAAAEAYVNNVFEALRPGDISGLKLDKKTQGLLYHGLTNTQYPSVTGQKTNLLGHLLEKYQYVEPDYSLIAEVTWLLNDREGYRNAIMQLGENKAAEKTVRSLKTEQGRKLHTGVDTDTSDTKKSRKLPRQTNFFQR